MISSPLERSRVRILSVEIDPLTMAEAVVVFCRLIERRRSSLVFNVNVDICMKIRRDESLRLIYREADLVLVDGTPMMWAGRFLGTPLPDRVSGSDFVTVFCNDAARKGYRLFLLGGLPGVGQCAKERMEQQYPGIQIVGVYSPPFGFEKDENENLRTISVVRAAEPDVLLASLGSPKQEKWLFRFRHQLQVPVAMGVGSAFDYFAGRLRRAPMRMQRMGLEWTFRLAQEPKRLWRRYLVEDPPFVYAVLREKARLQRSASHFGVGVNEAGRREAWDANRRPDGDPAGVPPNAPPFPPFRSK